MKGRVMKSVDIRLLPSPLLAIRIIRRKSVTNLFLFLLLFTLPSSSGCAVGYLIGLAIGHAISTTREDLRKEVLMYQNSNEELFYKEIGKPQKRYREGDLTVFVYECSDGKLFVYLDTAHLANKKMSIKKILGT